MSRFSKETVIDALQKRVDHHREKHGFDPDNGTAQLKGKLSGQEAAVAYGEFRLCLTIIQQIDDGSFVNLSEK